jgi:hypothetical protein
MLMGRLPVFLTVKARKNRDLVLEEVIFPEYNI